MTKEMTPATQQATAPAQAQDKSPMSMMLAAQAAGMDVDKLQSMMDLQLRWEANEARKAFVKAMADFKAEAPKITKDKHVEFKTSKGVTAYDHATLANVSNTIAKAMSKYQLAAGWTTKQSGQTITVTCRVTHALGHFEETSLSAAADCSGGKNAIQAVGSTITYLERYTLLALTGLATADQDDDGQASEPISEEQAQTIHDMIDMSGTDPEKFLRWLQVDSVESIPALWFNRTVQALNTKIRKAQQAKAVEESDSDNR